MCFIPSAISLREEALASTQMGIILIINIVILAHKHKPYQYQHTNLQYCQLSRGRAYSCGCQVMKFIFKSDDICVIDTL